MINKIKKIIPYSIRKALKPSRQIITKPRKMKPKVPIDGILAGMIAYNKYGGYCTPIDSQQRVAVQTILRGEVYEPETINFMMKNCGDGDIIHAGTYFGDFLPAIGRAISKRAKVWAFEPNPENFRCAQITKLINNLQNVELFNYGLGESTSKVKLQTATDAGTKLGGASKIVRDAKGDGLEDIKIVSIDDIIPQDRRISILQLDIEGYEKEALLGALKTINRCQPLLILEDNNQVIESDWFAENFLSIGYTVNRKLHTNTLLTIKSAHNIL